MTDEEVDRFLRNMKNDNDNEPTTVIQAIIYILIILGMFFMLVGLIAFMPTVFSYNFSLGLAYAGVVMVLFGLALHRI